MGDDFPIRAEKALYKTFKVLLFSLIGGRLIWRSIVDCFIRREYVDHRPQFLDTSMHGYWAFFPGVFMLGIGLFCLWGAYDALLGKDRETGGISRMYGIAMNPRAYRERRKARRHDP